MVQSLPPLTDTIAFFLTMMFYFYLWCSQAGLGLLCDVLDLLVLVVLLVDIFLLLSRRPPTKILKKLWILVRKDPVPNLSPVTNSFAKNAQKQSMILRFYVFGLFDLQSDLQIQI